MLQFLVTSKVRRRLLLLLWGEHASGSVRELAERACVVFSGAHAELKEMQRLQLVRVERSGSKEVYSANPHYPDADLLVRLVRSELQPLVTEPDDAMLKQQLVALGAPLRGVQPVPVTEGELLAVLARGVALARRDAVVARCLPLCFWSVREQLRGAEVASLRLSPEEKHAFAFFLDVAGELGGDRRLVGLAEVLRDERLKQLREFFFSTSATRTRAFPLAEKWGFSMNMEMESFRTLFAKHVAR